MTFADTTGGPIVLTLPDATQCKGLVFHLKNVGLGGDVSVHAPLSQLLEGDTHDGTIATGKAFTLTSDGMNWWILGFLDPAGW